MIAIPFDIRWGTYIRADNLFTWHGKTLLGQVLQAVPRRLRGIDASSFKSRPVLPPLASATRIDTVSDITFEVDPSITSSSPRRTNCGEQISWFGGNYIFALCATR